MTVFKTIFATLILISAAIFATNAEAQYASDFAVFTDRIVSWHSLNPQVWISVNQNRKALTGVINQGSLNTFNDHPDNHDDVPGINSVTFSDTTGNSCVVTYSMTWYVLWGLASFNFMYLSPGNNNMSCTFVGNNLIVINHKQETA